MTEFHQVTNSTPSSPTHTTFPSLLSGPASPAALASRETMSLSLSWISSVYRVREEESRVKQGKVIPPPRMTDPWLQESLFPRHRCRSCPPWLGVPLSSP